MRTRGGAASRLLLSISFVALVALPAGCRWSPDAAAATPKAPTVTAPAAKRVWAGRYAVDIQPIFDRSCVSCHGPSRAENGLQLTDHASVMKGTRFGPVVVPGLPAQSALISAVKGNADLSLRMPRAAGRLSDGEVENLVLWIQAGAPAD